MGSRRIENMMNIPKLAFVPVLALILTLIVLGVKGPAFGALMCITVIFAIIGRKPNAEKAEHE